MAQGVVVFGVGGAGQNYLKTFPDDPELIVGRVLIDASSALPSNPSRDHREHVPMRVLPLEMHRSLPYERQVDCALHPLKPVLSETLAEAQISVVCAGLGGQVGTLGSEALVRWLASTYPAIPVLGNFTMPFTHEGSRRSEVAKRAIVNLFPHCLSSLCVGLEGIRLPHPQMALLEAFRMIDAAWTNHIRNWCHLLHCRPCLVNDKD